MNYNKIKVIAFDADDTLWNNEPYFRNAEHALCRMLAPYGTEEELSERIFGVEMANMLDYGYGAIAFTMSLANVVFPVPAEPCRIITTWSERSVMNCVNTSSACPCSDVGGSPKA